MKGNDEYANMYVAGSEGPCVGRVHGNEACKWRSRGVAVMIVGGVEQLSMLLVMLVAGWTEEWLRTML